MRIRGNDASIPARRGRQWRFPIELSSNQPRHQIQRFRSLAAGRRPCHELGMEPQSQLAAYTDTDKAHELDLGAIPRVHSHPAIRPFDLSAREARTNRDGWPTGQQAFAASEPDGASSNAHCVASDVIPPSSRIKRYAHDRRRSKQRIEPGREPGPRLRNLEKPANI